MLLSAHGSLPPRGLYGLMAIVASAPERLPLCPKSIRHFRNCGS